MLHSCIKGFLRAKKLWVNPPKAERAKPSLSSDYNLLFKNKIGESSLDIHRFAYRDHLRDATKMIARLKSRGPGTARTIKPEYPYYLYVQKTCVQITVGVLLANDYFYATEM